VDETLREDRLRLLWLDTRLLELRLIWLDVSLLEIDVWLEERLPGLLEELLEREDELLGGELARLDKLLLLEDCASLISLSFGDPPPQAVKIKHKPPHAARTRKLRLVIFILLFCGIQSQKSRAGIRFWFRVRAQCSAGEDFFAIWFWSRFPVLYSKNLGFWKRWAGSNLGLEGAEP